MVLRDRSELIHLGGGLLLMMVVKERNVLKFCISFREPAIDNKFALCVLDTLKDSSK